VAKCELGSNPAAFDRFLSIFQYQNSHKTGYDWSTNWSLGGLIIERESISVTFENGDWTATALGRTPEGRAIRYFDYSPLIAAMRCFVASKLGDEVEVPDELQGEIA